MYKQNRDGKPSRGVLYQLQVYDNIQQASLFLAVWLDDIRHRRQLKRQWVHLFSPHHPVQSSLYSPLSFSLFPPTLAHIAFSHSLFSPSSTAYIGVAVLFTIQRFLFLWFRVCVVVAVLYSKKKQLPFYAAAFPHSLYSNTTPPPCRKCSRALYCDPM